MPAPPAIEVYYSNTVALANQPPTRPLLKHKQEPDRNRKKIRQVEVRTKAKA